MNKKKKTDDLFFSLEELEAELRAEIEKQNVTGVKRFFIRISDGFIDLAIYLRRFLSLLAGVFRRKKKTPLLSSDTSASDEDQLTVIVSEKAENHADEKDDTDELKQKRKEYRRKVFAIIKNTLSTLAMVAAVAVLVANLWLPVLRIYGSSMTPTVEEGEIVVSVKGLRFKTGDMVGFYYNNKILIKRVIAGPGSWVDIDKYGNVYVDGEQLEEPYLQEQAFGECDIELPYQVPDGRYFVMGDHRSTSVDSRNKAVGCISDDQVIGKIFFRVWPIDSFGFI